MYEYNNVNMSKPPNSPYEGIEVFPNDTANTEKQVHYHSAPESIFANGDGAKEAYNVAGLHPNEEQVHVNRSDELPEVSSAAPPKRKFCGLSAPLFWAILIGVVVITLGAVVGGGVAGSLAHKNKSSANAAQR